jgi:hypothetical protein
MKRIDRSGATGNGDCRAARYVTAPAGAYGIPVAFHPAQIAPTRRVHDLNGVKGGDAPGGGRRKTRGTNGSRGAFDYSAGRCNEQALEH